MKLTIMGDAKVREEEDQQMEPVFGADTSSLDGVECQDEFMEYFWTDNAKVEEEMRKIVHKGLMSFHYDTARTTLVTHTTYEVDRKLTRIELAALKDYTQGQWSDGIGEGFEQSPARDEFFISAWYRDQEVRHEYSE